MTIDLHRLLKDYQVLLREEIMKRANENYQQRVKELYEKVYIDVIEEVFGICLTKEQNSDKLSL